MAFVLLATQTRVIGAVELVATASPPVMTEPAMNAATILPVEERAMRSPLPIRLRERSGEVGQSQSVTRARPVRILGQNGPLATLTPLIPGSV